MDERLKMMKDLNVSKCNLLLFILDLSERESFNTKSKSHMNIREGINITK